MARRAFSIVLSVCCFWCVSRQAAAQANVNPTGDAAKAPRRILTVDPGGHIGGVYRLVPNGYGDQLISVGTDKAIRIWDIGTGESIRVLRPPIDREALGYLYGADLASDNDTLAVGGYRALTPVGDHRIRLISLASGQTIRLLKGHTLSVQDLAFSPDGKRLASVSIDKTARIWDVQTGETLHVLTGHTAAVQAVAWSPDGAHLVTGAEDFTARIWNTSTGASEAVLAGHRDEVNTVAWSPDGRTVATGCDDMVIRLFEPSGKARYSWPPRPNKVSGISFSPDSTRLLYSYCADEGTWGAGVVSMVDGRQISQFGGHENGVVRCVFLRDGKTAASSDSVGCICLWDAATGQLIRRLQGRGDTIYGTGWSPDWQYIAWGNTNQVDDYTQLSPIERTFSFYTLDFGGPPRGNYIRAQFTLGPLSIEKTGHRVATVSRNGSVLTSFNLRDSYDRVYSWSLLADNRAVLGGNSNATVYDVESGQIHGDLYCDRGEIMFSLGPSPDFRYVLGGGAGQTLGVWNADTCEELLELFVGGDEWIAWTPDGYYAASLGGENLMGWHINNGVDEMASFYPAARFHASLYRPDIIRHVLYAGSVQKARAMADKTAVITSQSVVITSEIPPTVKVELKRPDESVPTVQISATATPSGASPVKSMQLLVDGRPNGAAQSIESSQQSAGGKASAQQQAWSVDLPPGKHRIDVLASTDNSYGLGESNIKINPVADDPSPSDTIEKAASRNLYVLAIGVSAYQNAALRLPSAKSDAAAVVEAFEKAGKSGYANVQTKIIADDQATRTGILQGLAWLQGEMTLTDVGIIYVAAQTAYDQQGNVQILPFNTPSPGVTAQELKQTLAATRGKLVALLDVHVPANPPGKSEELTFRPLDPLVRRLLADDCGVSVLTSATRREVPIESSAGARGFFVQALADGLQGAADANQDQRIDVKELGSFVAARVPTLTQDRQHPAFRLPTLVRPFRIIKLAAPAK